MKARRKVSGQATAALARAGSVRIIGGAWKRRTLEVVDAPGLRPTPGRVRETLFNWLTHAFDGVFETHTALDLFAGSGALGIEAASRGARAVTLVENNPAALAALRRAREHLNAGQLDIRAGDGFAVARSMIEAAERFDVVFLDPPFGQQWLADALPLSVSLCEPSGFIYAESDAPLTDDALRALGLDRYRADKAGEVFYHLLRRNK